MKIEKNLPFESCDSCDQCVLDVNEQILFYGGGFGERIVTVGCKNERLCKRLLAKQKNEGDVKNAD